MGYPRAAIDRLGRHVAGLQYSAAVYQPGQRIECRQWIVGPFGSAIADAPKSKNAKVTLVYQHELPNVPGKSIKGVLVESGPGGYSPGHTHPKSAFIYATLLEGEILSQVNDGR